MGNSGLTSKHIETIMYKHNIFTNERVNKEKIFQIKFLELSI